MINRTFTHFLKVNQISLLGLILYTLAKKLGLGMSVFPLSCYYESCHMQVQASMMREYWRDLICRDLGWLDISLSLSVVIKFSSAMHRGAAAGKLVTLVILFLSWTLPAPSLLWSPGSTSWHVIYFLVVQGNVFHSPNIISFSLLLLCVYSAVPSTLFPAFY